MGEREAGLAIKGRGDYQLTGLAGFFAKTGILPKQRTRPGGEQGSEEPDLVILHSLHKGTNLSSTA